MYTSPRASSETGSRRRRRDGLDRAQVRGDVLAGRAVAARRALDEAAALVAQRDREAVDLQLGDVAEVRGRLGRRRQAEAAPDAGVERPQLVVAERVREREHRAAVADLVERARELRADALRRRVRRDERRATRSRARRAAGRAGPTRRRAAIGASAVVGGVGRLDLLGELGVARRGLGLLERGRLGDERRVDRQPVGPRPSSASARRLLRNVRHGAKDTEAPASAVRENRGDDRPRARDRAPLPARLARRRPRAVRRAERRPGGDGALPEPRSTAAASDALVDADRRRTGPRTGSGCGRWSASTDGAFLGFTGLSQAVVRGALHAGGRGRLAARARRLGPRLRDGGGAARRCAFGFETVGLEEIVSFTVPGERALAARSWSGSA